MRYLFTWKKLDPNEKEKILDELGGRSDTFYTDGYYIYSEKPLVEVDDGIIIGRKTYEEYNIEVPHEEFSYKDIDRRLDGRYLYINLSRGEVLRDPLGLQPAYVGRYGIASSKKLLWIIGDSNAFQLPPNYIWRMGDRNILSRGGHVVDIHGENIDVDIHKAAGELGEYLLSRTRKIAEYVKKSENKVYIAFSGGVDSSLTYILSEKAGLDPVPVTVCKKGAYDENASKKSAEMLGAEDKHLIIYINKDKIDWEEIRNIVQLIEDPNMMQVSLSIPMYVLVRYIASGNTLFMGQGSDELYGGYQKYLETYVERGGDAAHRKIILDVIMSYRFNFAREAKIAYEYSVDLWYPLISPGIVYYVLNMPLDVKISNVKDETRKRLIRLTAEKLGLPIDIAYRKKKAMQYSSKSQDILIKTLGKRKISEILYHFYLDMVMSYINE